MTDAGKRSNSEQQRQSTADAARPFRDFSIDRLRGVLVIAMVIGDFLGGIQSVPSFLQHAPDIGLTIADTVAPAFVFVIGLNFGPSFVRRSRSGGAEAYRHFLWRYLGLIGLGAIISGGGALVGSPTTWGVLQAIGVAGLLCLLVIQLPTWARFVVGALLLLGYQYVLDEGMLQSVLESVHGGFFGALSWAALLILSTAVADVWRRGMTPYLVCCGALVVIAGVSALLIPVSKHRVSLSFIMITLAISAVVFLVVKALDRRGRWREGFLCWWGQNALALYLLHLVVLAVFVLPDSPWWYSQAPLWLATLQVTAIIAFMSTVAWWLQKRWQLSPAGSSAKAS